MKNADKPCEPPDACATHGRCWTHSEWVDGQDKAWWPCLEKPELLLGQPLGMYHCPMCGEMQMAGMPHIAPQFPEQWECGGLDGPGEKCGDDFKCWVHRQACELP